MLGVARRDELPLGPQTRKKPHKHRKTPDLLGFQGSRQGKLDIPSRVGLVEFTWPPPETEAPGVPGDLCPGPALRHGSDSTLSFLSGASRARHSTRHKEGSWG